VRSAVLHLKSARRLARPRPLRHALGSPDERLVFVLGSPRSGTTFLAGAIGQVPGFVDLGEVAAIKAAVPDLAAMPPEEAGARLRRMLRVTRTIGLVRGLRGVEQTPETAFLAPALVRAYPQARLVHMLRDGRDVACSLLEKGWLRTDRAGGDDVGLPYGSHARSWVEPERVEEFERASEARRAGWAWRSYLSAARTGAPEALEVRYEGLAADPGENATRIAEHIDADPEPLARELSAVHAESVGRWRRDLTSDQVADVEAEAGPLLRELGYA
jgi:hypothetical protein